VCVCVCVCVFGNNFECFWCEEKKEKIKKKQKKMLK
jgi:hypothetical protein